ncbi:PREDICTED: probable peroxidase 61 [Ipomoea nil]|uniref:probable peroxidase 61 n=1 Tax=Ipomoea nil TaxID=35883 RepID=UPI000901CBAD|nr:PREDICTED: probable peroxidase 61 [Ipomoea nil]
MDREGILVVVVSLVVLGLSLREASVVSAAVTPQPAANGKTTLVRQYYKKLNTCKNAEAFVKQQVEMMWKRDKSLTAKLLKLLYADCMVNGCDGSILLNGANSERNAIQNIGLRGYEAINTIKRMLEIRCRGVVSCSDILVIATRDAVALAGGPSYPVLLGRRDGRESKASWIDYPSPSITWEEGLAYFESKGLNVQDFVTLMGAHTMGKTHCRYILDRLYNYKNTSKPDPTMSLSLLKSLRKLCPPKTQKGQHDPLVYLTPEGHPENYKFTNTYYSRILKNQSVLTIDQQLLYGADTNELVNEYAAGFGDFKFGFALSMNRMTSLKVLTGTQGEIRRECSRTN